MKHLLTTTLLVLGFGIAASAQDQRPIRDDIYFNSSDIEQLKKEDRERANRIQDANYDRASGSNGYGNSGNYENYGRSYQSDGDYYADNDDVNYAARIRRFNYPFSNVGYYSPYYNPYWYDPFWVDPLWGWSPWTRPGISISFGFGQPYWSSAWGWNSWWGYPGFVSTWSYPCYGNWWGNYYSGYWNGYYAGLNGGGWAVTQRAYTYGPRNASNAAATIGTRQAVTSSRPEGAYGSRANYGVRGATSNSVAAPPVNGPRSGERYGGGNGYTNPQNPGNGSIRANTPPDRVPASNNDRPTRGIFQSNPSSYDGRDNGAIRDNNTIRNNPSDRGNSFDRGNGIERQPDIRDNRGFEQRQPAEQRYNAPRFEAPRQDNRSRGFDMPRSQPMNQQRSFESPSMQQSAPRFESPRQSAPMQSAPAPRSGGFEGGGRRR